VACEVLTRTLRVTMASKPEDFETGSSAGVWDGVVRKV
jgi:hypothetical protein